MKFPKVEPSHMVLSVLSLVAGLGMLCYVAHSVPGLSHFAPEALRIPGGFLSLLIGTTYFLYLIFRVPHTSLCDHVRPALWLFLPSALIFSLGYSFSNAYPTILKAFIGVYFFFAGYLVVRHLLQARASEEKALPRAPFAIKAFLLSLTFVGIFLFYGLKNIGEFAAVDEALWLYGRIHRYFYNFTDGEWRKTAVSDKPGITVSLLAGPGLFFESNPRKMEDYTGQGHLDGGREIIAFYKAFRIPFYLGATTLLILILYFVHRLFETKEAVMISALLTTSPILIGTPKIINPDGLLWLFTTLAILTYLLYRQKPFRHYLVLSGIFLGFALLTKYVANILFVFLLVHFLLEYIFQRAQKRDIRDFFKKRLSDFLILFYVATLTYFVVLPAAWVEPRLIIDATFNSQAFQSFALPFLLLFLALFVETYFHRAQILAWLSPWAQKLRLPVALGIILVFYGSALYAFIETWLGMTHYDFISILSSPKSINSATGLLGAFFANFYAQIFSQTAPVFFGLIFLAAGLLWHIASNARVQLKNQFNIWFLLTLPLVYYLGSALSGVGAIIRYQIIIYPLVIILAGFGLAWLTSYFKRILSLPNYFASSVIIVFILGYGIFILQDTPFPGSYSSRLLPTQYIIDIKDMGPGSYEIAQMLNAVPDAEHKLIWSDKGGVCTFFVGRCVSSPGSATLANPLIDYAVVSSGRASRVAGMTHSKTLKHPEYLPLHSYYDSSSTPDLAIYINGRESQYVKAYAYHSPLREAYEEKIKAAQTAEDKAFIEAFEKSLKSTGSQADPLAGEE